MNFLISVNLRAAWVVFWLSFWVQSGVTGVCLSCSWRGQMFEWSRGRGLRILLLPGELHLRHGRDAWNLRALPPHSCYLQHRGGSVTPLARPSICSSTCQSHPCVCGSAGQNFCEEESAVHLPGNLVEGLPNHPPLQHLPEDDRRGGRPLWETDVI